ncbi:MAG: hypothetical protein ABIJ57_01790 [Pseudomonadota bacterium]
MSNDPKADKAEALARKADPVESAIAADAMKGRPAARCETLILKALLKALPDGLTNHQICAETGLPWGSATPRIKPLRVAGLIEDRMIDGHPVRRYDSRTPSRVWFLTPAGVEEANRE